MLLKMCPHKGKQISKEKVKGSPGSCTSFILFTSCYCDDGSKYVIGKSGKLHCLDHCYSKGFMSGFFSLFLLFIKQICNVKKSLKAGLLSFNSYQCIFIDWESTTCRYTGTSPTHTPQSFLPILTEEEKDFLLSLL